MSNVEIDGVKEIYSEGEDIGYVRGRRTCVSQNQIENEEQTDKNNDKQFSQKQLENTLSQREDILVDQYEIIIAELTLKLKDLEEQLQKENEQSLLQLEYAINYVVEAHTCPFNCFKGQDIKNIEPLSQVRESSSTTTSKDLDVQIRDKNLSTPGSINFVQDKQFKANLFLQKKLENAGKEIKKNKQLFQSKIDDLQQKHDQLLQQLVQKSEVDEQQGGQLEEQAIKINGSEEFNASLKQKYDQILDFIKEQFNLEIKDESEEDQDKFSSYISEWERIILKKKEDIQNLENDLETTKKDLSQKSKTLSQRESEHDALIQKIAQAEIMIDEYKQENNHFNEKLQYETQKRKDIEQNYKNDISEIYQLLEGNQEKEGYSLSELKESIIFQIRILQRDCEKMSSHKISLEKLDEENFQMKLDLQRTTSLNNNLEKLRNDYDTLNYKYLQAQEQIMLLDQEKQRIIRDKQNSDEIQMENLKNLNQKLVQEIASLHQTRSRESSDLQEKLEKLSNKLSNIKKENEDLKQLIRSRNNTQDNCQETMDDEIQIEKALQRLDTIEEQRRGESLDSDRKSSLIISIEDKKIDIVDDAFSQQMHLKQEGSDQINEGINSIIEEEHRPIFEINNMQQLRHSFLQLYKKLKDDKVYAEQTAIDTKVQLAEMAMSRDYFEHNFIKLLKKVK